MPLSPLASCALPTEHGTFTLQVFGEGTEQVVAVVHQSGETLTEPLVRMHSACLTGDLLGSLRCDCGPQLSASLRMIGAESYGILIYLTGHEGRGIGLVDKIRAYAHQEQGLDTVEANQRLGLPVDTRDYTGAVHALRALGVSSVRLATNNPDKVRALTNAGLGVRRISLNGFVSTHNRDYLRTKDEVMGHLDSQGLVPHGTTS